MPKYDKNTINNETTIAIGMDFCGVFASSPTNTKTKRIGKMWHMKRFMLYLQLLYNQNR